LLLLALSSPSRLLRNVAVNEVEPCVAAFF
jgi:hypothetical protein